MKPNTFVVTPDNIQDIRGRLEKFFFNNNRTGFVKWTNYDCGFKKRIKPRIVTVDDDEFFVRGQQLVYYYPGTEHVRIILPNDNETYPIIEILLKDAGNPNPKYHLDTLVFVGDEVAFLGNRIILKSAFDDHHAYVVYQVSELKI